jgi:hypothetical protein
MRLFDNYIIEIPTGEMRQYRSVKVSDLPEHVYREVLQQGMTNYAYRIGLIEPNYPVPATTLDALLAVPYENIMPQVKAWLLEQKS